MAVGTIRILLAAVIMLDCSCNPKERKMIFDDCDSISPSVVYFKACNRNDPIVFKVDDTYYTMWCQDFYGAAIGVAIMETLTVSMTMIRINVYWQNIVVGIIIIIAVNTFI